MEKLKKILSFLLIVSVLVSFSGCKKEVKKEYETFIWYYPCQTFRDSQLVNDKANEIFREKLGVEVKLVPVSTDFYNEKMSTVISMNEEYDICYTSNWTNNFYDNVIYEEEYVQLDELLRETPFLQETIPEIAWTGAKIEGKICAVPNYQILDGGQRCLMIEEDVYEKYKELFDNVKTIEDIEPVLEAESKDGGAEYLLDNKNHSDFWLMNEQIVGAEMFSVKVGDSKVFCSYLQPEYKEYIELMSKWYNKGYIENKNITNLNGETKIVVTMYKPGAIIYDDEGNRKKMKILILSEAILSQNVGGSAMTAISKKCKNPLMALKIIELVNKDKELYNLLCFGVEGKHFEKESENVITLKNTMDYRPHKDWVFGNQFNAYYTSAEDVGSWEETDKINKFAKCGKLMGFTFDQKNVKDEIMMLKSIVSEYSYLSNGVSNIGDDYDEFVQKLKDAGCEKVEKEIQRQIDEFLAKKEIGG